ncbi:hypothetical protein ILYODFUR_034624 [Ilyodon furcidens]|uniref:Uncharacterized protein n=1 Tax=Ilyodon furcidens TaxID=33524 RepID=A0ABV0T2M3_9TELE
MTSLGATDSGPCIFRIPSSLSVTLRLFPYSCRNDVTVEQASSHRAPRPSHEPSGSILQDSFAPLAFWKNLRACRRTVRSDAIRLVLNSSPTNQSAENQSAENQSAENQSAENQSAENQSAENQSAGQK